MNIDDIKTIAVIGAGDLALTNSSGNPIGPMSVAKNVDPADLAKRLEGLAGKYNKEIFKPAKMVREGTYK